MLILDLMVRKCVPKIVFWKHANRAALSHHLLGIDFSTELCASQIQRAFLPAVVHPFIHSVNTCQLRAVDCAGSWGRKDVKGLVPVLR